VSDTPQGPGWWQASDGKWYPPEQAPGGTPTPGPGSVAGGGGSVDVGAAFSWAWNKFQANIQPLLILGASVAIVQIVWSVASFFAVDSFLVQIGGNLAVSVITLILMMLTVQAGLDLANGQAIDTSSIFKIRANAGTYVVASILFGIMQIIGCLLLCIGLVFVWLIFGLWSFAVVDKNAGVIESFTRSKDLTMANFGQTFVPMLVYLALMAIGPGVCGLLGVVTLPLGAVYGAYVFKQLSGEPVAA
jgi:uncharacterized membrane protein